MTGIFYDVKPRNVKDSYHPSEWVFGHYFESPSQRNDGLWYAAYLFRNTERSIYGAAVYLGKDLPKIDPRDWATKVITDSQYRERHITQDQGIIKLWKRH